MKKCSGKRSSNKRKSKPGKCLHKRTKVDGDPESENIPPFPTPSQNKTVIDNVRKILSQTPSHLNVTASADHGSPVTAPTISQTSVNGNITIHHNFTTVVLQNPSDGSLNNSDVKEGTNGEYQIMPSTNTKQTLEKHKNSNRRRHLSFRNHLEQPTTLTLAEVKKNTNHLRGVTVAGKILERNPAINILPSEEGMDYSHYILSDTTADVHLSLAQDFNVSLNQWYIFKSVSICDFGTGNVLCSTEYTSLEQITPLDVQDPKETVITGVVTEALMIFDYICSCGATLALSSTMFRIKCKECKKSCKCDNVQNRAKANITIKQVDGGNERVVLNDALLHSIVSFKTEGYCDCQQLEERLLRAEKMTVVCVDDEPQCVQIEEKEKPKGDVKGIFKWGRCCVV